MLDYAGRKKELKAKFALVPETKPQKPRPWWPEEWEAREVTEEIISDLV